MNEKKLEQLFAAARNESAPPPPVDFAADVLRAVRNDHTAGALENFTLFDQLNQWFPRLALAAIMLIVLCVAGDMALTAAGLPDVDDNTTPFASQYFAGLEEL